VKRIATLPVRQPFPWEALLAYLSLRLTPLVERVEDGRFVRRLGESEVAVNYDAERFHLVISAGGQVDKRMVLERTAALFDSDYDAQPVEALLGQSRALKKLIARTPGMRPPGAWSAFELCVRTVIGQQVSVAAARTLFARLAERCGAITPEALLAADLSAIGMPGRRVASLLALARAIEEEDLQLEGRPWAETDEALRALPGFGPWTRAYLGIRLGREADAFPESDLGLMRAAGADTPASLLRLAERWRPYRAHAAIHLWTAGAPARFSTTLR